MRNQSEHIVKIGEVEGDDLFEVSVSKIKTYQGCPHKFKYKYVDKLRPRKKAVALRRGTWVHSCLEDRDSGKDWVETIKKLKVEEYDKLFAEEKVELGDLPQEVFRIMRAYHHTYLEVDKTYQTIRCEQDFMIRVPGTKIVLTGKIDKLALHIPSQNVWIFEHKTVKKDIPSEDYRMTDVQTAIYAWVWSMIAETLGYKDFGFGGVMMDYIKTKAPTIPEPLKNGSMSRRKIDTDRWTYEAALKRANLNPADYEDFMKELQYEGFRRLPLSKNPKTVQTIFAELVYSAREAHHRVTNNSIFPRNLSWTCDRPKCEYRDLCLAELQGLDTDTLINIQFERGDDNGKKQDESDTESDD